MNQGPVAELVDAIDLKSIAIPGVPVRVRPGPPLNRKCKNSSVFIEYKAIVQHWLVKSKTVFFMTPDRKALPSLIATTCILIIITLVGSFLSLWSFILVPLVLGILLAFFISATALKVTDFVKIPYWSSLLLVVIFIVFVGYIIAQIVSSSFQEIVKTDLSILRIRLDNLLKNSLAVLEPLGFDVTVLLENFDKTLLRNLLETFNTQTLLSNFSASALTVFGMTILVILYVALILAEQRHFKNKIRAMFPNDESHYSALNTLAIVSQKIQIYLRVKTFTSALTGIVSASLLFLFGVEHAVFWGFLIFLLNYIPNIGSIIAVTLPLVFAFITIDSLSKIALLLASLTVCQQLIGSYLEPRLMGNSLNISPVVVILSLLVWGSIWGIPGMFLCVPLTVIVMLVLAEYPATRSIAILFSAKGQI